jgi:hypothetical protein
LVIWKFVFFDDSHEGSSSEGAGGGEEGSGDAGTDSGYGVALVGETNVRGTGLAVGVVHCSSSGWGYLYIKISEFWVLRDRS